MASLKQAFFEHFNVPITNRQYTAFMNHVKIYEFRDEHPVGLNSPLLGVVKMYFLDKDRNALFDIFGIDRTQFNTIMDTVESLDRSKKVRSDDYHLATVWLLYLVGQSKLSVKYKHELQLALLKMFHYKIFMGQVHRSFKHGANHEIMEYTIDDLTAKNDIKQKNTPTWRLVLEARGTDVLSSRSIHAKTVQRFVDDEQVYYLVSDMATRVNTRVWNIAEKYYQNHKDGNRIATYQTVAQIGDEKVIQSVVNSLDGMITEVANRALNTNEFIDATSIKLVSKLSSGLREDIFRSLLMKFSAVANDQHRKGAGDLINGRGKHEIIEGYRMMISTIIQKTYRVAALSSDVDMKSKVSILDKARNTYRNSQVDDVDIVMIKRSVDAFVTKYSDSTRSSTNASLKIGFIIYIILLSMKSM